MSQKPILFDVDSVASALDFNSRDVVNASVLTGTASTEAVVLGMIRDDRLSPNFMAHMVKSYFNMVLIAAIHDSLDEVSNFFDILDESKSLAPLGYTPEAHILGANAIMLVLAHQAGVLTIDDLFPTRKLTVEERTHFEFRLAEIHALWIKQARNPETGMAAFTSTVYDTNQEMLEGGERTTTPEQVLEYYLRKHGGEA